MQAKQYNQTVTTNLLLNFKSSGRVAIDFKCMPTQSQTYLTTKTFTKSSQQLFDSLIYPIVKKPQNKIPSNQSYSLTKVNEPVTNSKRIRTEGNDQQQHLNPYMYVGVGDNRAAKSRSPIKTNQINSLIKTLLTNKQSNDKRMTRENRNQSADFQTLMKPSQKQVPPKQKFKSFGNLNDHIYFTQRGIDSKQKDDPKVLQDYYRNLLSGRQQPITTYKCNQTPPTHKLTISQFKEKLSNIRSQAGSDIKIKRKHSHTQTTQPPTQKKVPQNVQYAFEDSGKVQLKNKRIRTEASQHFSRISRQSEEDHELEQQQHMIRYYDATPILTQTFEDKLDIMCNEINCLKKKSDILEVQNKMLFENLNKIQQEKDCTSNERQTLIVKLDQMIGMQKKQEDNLMFFRTVFTDGCRDTKELV